MFVLRAQEKQVFAFIHSLAYGRLTINTNEKNYVFTALFIISKESKRTFA